MLYFSDALQKQDTRDKGVRGGAARAVLHGHGRRRIYKENVKYTAACAATTLNGRAYKDDPTIMAWGLLNEPRCETWKVPCPRVCVAALAVGPPRTRECCGLLAHESGCSAEEAGHVMWNSVCEVLENLSQACI